MATYKVGYFVGSLSSTSINRLLAKALVRLAPPALSRTPNSLLDPSVSRRTGERARTPALCGRARCVPCAPPRRSHPPSRCGGWRQKLEEKPYLR